MRLRCQTFSLPGGLGLSPPPPENQLDPGRHLPRPGLSLVLIPLPLLASCAFFSPSTTVSVQVAKPNGETISAEYHSTKDIAAPSFVFERNPETGQVETIQVTAEGTSASAVIQSQSESIANLADLLATTKP